MANDADAAELTVNGTTTAAPASVKQVRQLSEPTDAPPMATGNSGPGDNSTDVDAGERVGASSQTRALDGDEQAQTEEDAGERRARASGVTEGVWLALILGLFGVLVLGGLAGWLGFDAYQAHQTDKMRNVFLAVGKQGALNLTTVSYTEADADIQRILDSSTGQFYNDFSKRAPAFVDVVKQAQAKTDGSIVEAGVESVSGDSARVLVAVLVKTSNKGATDQQPRHWRMRIDVQKVGDTVKVANVGFVP